MNKKLSFIFFTLLFFYVLGFFSPTFSSERIDIEVLKNDKGVLREIANIIFNREKSITYIQDKICTHSPELFEIWKDNKWQTINTDKRRDLEEMLESKYKIVASQTRRLLQRDDFSLLNVDIIKNYIDYGNAAIKEAKNQDIMLIKNPGNNRWAIKILTDFPSVEIGKLFKRSDLSNPTLSHTLDLTFDVDDIVNKITSAGIHAWDKHNDGFASTMCADQR